MHDAPCGIVRDGVVDRHGEFFFLKEDLENLFFMAFRDSIPQASKNRQACVDALPRTSSYDVIVMDPPWPYSRSRSPKFRGGVEYETMTLAALGRLHISRLAKPDAALLMWCTGPQLPNALPLFDTWGFAYKTVFLVWRKIYRSGKPVMGPGWYTRPCHEFLLLGVRGSVLSMRQSKRLSQLLDQSEEVSLVCTPAGHSVKPAESFQVIDEFFGSEARKIELFSRSPRMGWDVWGMEIDGYFQRALIHAPMEDTLPADANKENEPPGASVETNPTTTTTTTRSPSPERMASQGQKR